MWDVDGQGGKGTGKGRGRGRGRGLRGCAVDTIYHRAAKAEVLLFYPFYFAFLPLPQDLPSR